MHGVRTSVTACAVLLTVGFGCSGEDGATSSTGTDPGAGTSLPTTSGPPGSDGDDVDEDPDQPTPDTIVEPSDSSEVPDDSAPEALIGTELPADDAGVVALLRALPSGLFGAEKVLEASSPGELDARYLPDGRTNPVGYQALDIASVPFVDLLPEPTAEQLVSLFAQGAERRVGRDGDRSWVLWSTPASDDGVEASWNIAFGDDGSPWAFVVVAADARMREQLLGVFYAAAAAVPERPAPGPDDEAARAALLTAGELGPGWRRRIDLSDDGGFHDLATGLMRDEPVCADALDWLAGEDVTLTGWLDVVAVGALAVAESPSLVSPEGDLSVEHTVAVFESAEVATGAFAALQELGWYECVVAVFPELLASMVTPDLPDAVATVDASAPRELAVVDPSFAMRFEIALDAPSAGVTLESSQDVSIVVIDRSISAVVQQRVGEPLDPDAADDVAVLAAESVRERIG